MRAVLHVLSVVALLPYLALAGGFLLLGHAIGRASLFGFFESLITQAAWFVSWGGIAIFSAIGIVASLGLSSRARWVGAAGVCLLAAGCLVVLLTMSTTHITSGTLVFLLPCAGSSLAAGWLAAAEWPRRRKAEYAA